MLLSFSMSSHLTRFLPLLPAAVFVASGCKDRRIESYAIKKEPRVAVLAQPAISGSARLEVPGAAAVPDTTSTLVWTAPAHWKPKPASAMRRASFDVPLGGGAAADFSAIVLNGAAGGVLDNANRWRGQLGLAPLAEVQLAANIEVIAANGLTFTTVDFAGQTGGAPVRLLAAITEFGGDTWFFKLTGPEAGVAREKAAFLEFLRTVQSR